MKLVLILIGGGVLAYVIALGLSAYFSQRKPARKSK